MTHYHEINAANGDLEDLVPFCADSCHREWCREHGITYGGWNGAHDAEDYSEYCAQCGVIAGTGPESCEHQQDNIVVNRFLSDEGETCEHGNWIQLPAQMLDNA